jgi:hypothetical protein
VLTTNRLLRPAVVCALTCAALVPAGGGIAFAGTPQEEYYSSYTTPADDPALAQEQLYSSYGDPQPLTHAPASGAAGDEAPWLELTLASAGALAIAGVGATQVRRMRIRRRRVAEAGL